MMEAIRKRAEQAAIAAMRRQAMWRARSYRAVFTPADPHSIDRDREIVLADLRGFCCANRTTFSADPHEAARLQGRREAWLRIVQHLNLDEAAIIKLVEVDDGLGD